jgi:outer membrane immunogenic protein
LKFDRGGRLGWLAAPNVLIYGSAGFAYGRVGENGTEVINSPPLAGLPLTIISSDGSSLSCIGGAACLVGASWRTSTGWTAGGGAEFAVTPNISVKGEYLFVRLNGDAFALVAPATFPGFPIPASITASYNRVDLHTVRIGINYKFDWGKGPVAVRAAY